MICENWYIGAPLVFMGRDSALLLTVVKTAIADLLAISRNAGWRMKKPAEAGQVGRRFVDRLCLLNLIAKRPVLARWPKASEWLQLPAHGLALVPA